MIFAFKFIDPLLKFLILLYSVPVIIFFWINRNTIFTFLINFADIHFPES